MANSPKIYATKLLLVLLLQDTTANLCCATESVTEQTCLTLIRTSCELSFGVPSVPRRGRQLGDNASPSCSCLLAVSHDSPSRLPTPLQHECACHALCPFRHRHTIACREYNLLCSTVILRSCRGRIARWRHALCSSLYTGHKSYLGSRKLYSGTMRV